MLLSRGESPVAGHRIRLVPMRLTVIGKSPAWSDAGGACSGYLVAEGKASILLDCGNGVFGKLRQLVDYREVDAVVITHLHGDHLLDLVPFSYALTLGPGSGERADRPRLLAPRGSGEFFRRLGATWGDEDLIGHAFALEEYEPRSEHEVGGVALRTHPVPHVSLTQAIELTSPSGGRIVVGADGCYSQELIAAASGADLLVAEATLPDPDSTQQVHMSAEEAGRLAAVAGVGRLVLTHISDELDLDRAVERARSGFAGSVEVAREGLEIDVG